MHLTSPDMKDPRMQRLIHSDEFKEWFGEWEVPNPKHCSKVVNKHPGGTIEIGKRFKSFGQVSPRMVWIHDIADITQWHLTKFTNSFVFGDGTSCFLNIRNPIIEKEKNIRLSGILEFKIELLIAQYKRKMEAATDEVKEHVTRQIMTRQPEMLLWVMQDWGLTGVSHEIHEMLINKTIREKASILYQHGYDGVFHPVSEHFSNYYPFIPDKQVRLIELRGDDFHLAKLSDHPDKDIAALNDAGIKIVEEEKPKKAKGGPVKKEKDRFSNWVDREKFKKLITTPEFKEWFGSSKVVGADMVISRGQIVQSGTQHVPQVVYWLSNFSASPEGLLEFDNTDSYGTSFSCVLNIRNPIIAPDYHDIRTALAKKVSDIAIQTRWSLKHASKAESEKITAEVLLRYPNMLIWAMQADGIIDTVSDMEALELAAILYAHGYDGIMQGFRWIPFVPDKQVRLIELRGDEYHLAKLSDHPDKDIASLNDAGIKVPQMAAGGPVTTNLTKSGVSGMSYGGQPASAIYSGPSHDEGGIHVTVQSSAGSKPIEVEGDEYKICAEAYYSDEVITLKNVTNKQLLDYIHNEFSCKFEQHKADAGDFIVCKRVVLSEQKRDRSGTVRQILNQIQGEGGCKVEYPVERSETNKTEKQFQEGGVLPEFKDKVSVRDAINKKYKRYGGTDVPRSDYHVSLDTTLTVKYDGIIKPEHISEYMKDGGNTRHSSLVTRHSFNFPSASAIEFYDNRLFIIGDDATDLLVVDAVTLEEERRVPILKNKHDLPRIPKKKKRDLEAAARLGDYLYVFGSASKERRIKALKIRLNDYSVNNISDRYERLINKLGKRVKSSSELDKPINIEGAAFVKGQLILANRESCSLVVTTPAPILDGISRIIPLTGLADKVGISGMCYIAQLDTLLFTASTEDRDNPIDDGRIGDSYLGIIREFSTAIKNGGVSIEPEIINLSAHDAVFFGQKIESVAYGNDNLYFVADNDDGTTRLFVTGYNRLLNGEISYGAGGPVQEQRIAWDAEQYFQDHDVFVNGLTNKPAHMDSYMTVMDFAAFDKAWPGIKNEYSLKQWEEAVDYWKSQNYLTPMAGLLAKMVLSKFPQKQVTMIENAAQSQAARIALLKQKFWR